MKGYKALYEGLTAINGFQYEIGKEYTIDGEPEMCKNGFHFCMGIMDVFGYYGFSKKETVVCEVEAGGKIVQEGTKFCAEKIKLIRVLEWKEIEKIININQIDNTGECNSGRYNSGNYNSGYHNSGAFNSGNWNSGFCNSRSYNSGNYNSGYYNSGSNNNGNYNSGHYNSGHYNSGNYNNGNYNTGHHNSGNYNSGFFNTDTPTVRLFNKDSGMSFRAFKSLGIDFRDLESCKKKIQSLPNYDAKIFYECTGIDWRDEE